MIFSIDEMDWDIGCTVERTSEMQSSGISGMMLDKSYFNDVIGTYLKYDIRLEVPFGKEQDYNSLYEKLNDPVSEHHVNIPYAGGYTFQIYGRISSVKDVYVRMKSGEIHWKGVQFSIISNYPSKWQTLDESIMSRGASKLPPDTNVNVGEVYVYGRNGWEELPSGDDNYY